MYKINFSKLTKMWKNLKNRDVLTNELKPKKGTKVKMIAEGIFQGEEEYMTKPPKWFKDWNEKTFIPFKEKVEKDIVVMKQEIVEIKKDINAMKNTPTMKKELGLI